MKRIHKKTKDTVHYQIFSDEKYFSKNVWTDVRRVVVPMLKEGSDVVSRSCVTNSSVL